MEFSPSPKQTLFLWRLLVQPEGFFLNKEIKPAITASERAQLASAGLIEVEKRKATPKSRQSNYVLLTENGWNWAELHLDAPLPKQGAAALTILGKLLLKLKPRIAAGEMSLAGLLASPELSHVTPNEQEPSSASSTVSTDNAEAVLKGRLYEACRQLAGDGVYGVRIRLADLRLQLADVPRPELDQALQDLERSEAAALYPLDDPREIRPDDDAAALANVSGGKRHVMYLSRPQ